MEMFLSFYIILICQEEELSLMAVEKCVILDFYAARNKKKNLMPVYCNIYMYNYQRSEHSSSQMSHRCDPDPADLSTVNFKSKEFMVNLLFWGYSCCNILHFSLSDLTHYQFLFVPPACLALQARLRPAQWTRGTAACSSRRQQNAP